MIAAGADTVTDTPACEHFAARLRAGQLIVLEGARTRNPDGAGSAPRPVLGGLRRLHPRQLSALRELRRALALIPGFVAARLVFTWALGLGRDEAYTLVISRRLALSYFDHPPLHQWLAHFAALAVGETVLARLPFVLAFALASWGLYELTRAALRRDGGICGAVRAQCHALLLRLRRDLDRAGRAAAVASRRPRCASRDYSRASPTIRDLAALARRRAGLRPRRPSKYSAALTALGAALYLVGSPAPAKVA